jgi:hypothetical protein
MHLKMRLRHGQIRAGVKLEKSGNKKGGSYDTHRV